MYKFVLLVDIHCGALLTKVDETDPSIAKDIRQVFTVDEIYSNLEVLAGQLKMAKDDVLPIANYGAHDKVDRNKSINSKSKVNMFACGLREMMKLDEELMT